MNSPQVNLHRFKLGSLMAGFAEPFAQGSEAADIDIHDITLDSRQVKSGSLFFAAKGIHQHGLDYAQDAIDNGAVAIAWEPDGREPSTYSVPLLAVDNLAKNAGLIANRFFGTPSDSVSVVGITGTNGKTSVAHFIAQVVDHSDGRCGLIGTLGNGFPGELQSSGYTTPDAVEVHRLMGSFVDRQANSVVMEVSSHALDQGRVTAVNFDTAVFTNLTQDHLDYHGDMATYSEAKERLFHWPGLQHAVINADDSLGVKLIEEIGGRVDTVAYSVNGPVASVENLLATDIVADNKGLKFTVSGFGQNVAVSSKLTGAFNVQNLLAAMGVLLINGGSLADAARAIETLDAVPGRMQRIDSEADEPLIIIDFAHTPDALEKVLISLRMHIEGKLICVFGCGGDRDWRKRPFMGEIVERYADMHIITNDNPRSEDPQEIVQQIRAGLKTPRRMPVILDREEAIRAALDVATKGDCVLIAGKGHEDYQLIGDQRLSFSDQKVVEQLLREQRGQA